MAFPLTLLYVAVCLLSPGIFPPGISSLHVVDILGGLTILACAFAASGSGLFRRLETYLMLGLVAAGFLSILVTGWLGGAIAQIVWFIPNVAPFFFIFLSCRSLKKLKILVMVIVAVAFFIIYQGISAQIAADTTSLYVMCEFCRQGPAAVPILRSIGLGVLNDPNDLAQLLVALLPLLWLWWKRGKYAYNFCFTILPACILLTGIYFTHSRGGTLAVGVVLFFGFKDKLGLIAGSLLAGLGGAGALLLGITGGRGISEDDGGRMGLWRDAFIAFKSHPLFGVGARNFPDYNRSLTAHNSYLLSLAETGIVGYFFWMGMLVVGWYGLTALINVWNRNPKSKGDGDVVEARSSFANRPARSSLGVVPVAPPQLAGMAGVAFAENPWMRMRQSFSGSPVRYAAMNVAPAADDEAIAHFARIFRLSLVGFLAAAFFLSRTYSIALYILLGMATALQALAAQRSLGLQFGTIFKRIWVVIVLSIILLYVIIRIGSLGH